MTDLPQNIERSHFRARINYLPHKGQGYFHEIQRRQHTGRWVQFWDFDSKYFPIGEHDAKAAEMNEKAQRRLNAKQMEAAVQERKRREYQQNRRKAREEYRRWINHVPVLSADLYRESKLSTRYTGPPDGGAERRSFPEWADLYMRKNLPEWSEKAQQKKTSIRRRYDLPDRTRLY